ncbi:hypothetical protein HDU86_004207 [Geranomyces michiganensis]|nr:hypothetical protein HDU86_004207 [Geranomyces michiganensis]
MSSSKASDAVTPIPHPATADELHQRELHAAKLHDSIEAQVREEHAQERKSKEEREREQGREAESYRDEQSGIRSFDEVEEFDTEDEIFITTDYATYGDDHTQKDYDDRQERLRQFRRNRKQVERADK